MSMTDTAEYWEDVKRKSFNPPKRTMIHIRNSKCVHIKHVIGNTETSNYLNDITCYNCLKMLKVNGNIYNLIEGVSPKQQSVIDKEKHRFRFGKCICGSPMCERTNRSTGVKFLGCINFPECKHTMKI